MQRTNQSLVLVSYVVCRAKRIRAYSGTWYSTGWGLCAQYALNKKSETSTGIKSATLAIRGKYLCWLLAPLVWNGTGKFNKLINIDYYLYFVTGDIVGTFSLGPVDGLLRVAGSLDREKRANYTLEVTARDRGEPAKDNRQSLFIAVIDMNDNSPVFDPKQYSASVPENASIGASVLQVVSVEYWNPDWHCFSTI